MKHLEKIRRYGLAALGMLAIMAPAAVSAAEQPFTPAMSCASARNTVQTRGAVVLWTGQNLYDRYVDSGGFCPLMTRTQAAWVPARDNPQCFVGYTCEQTDSRRWR